MEDNMMKQDEQRAEEYAQPADKGNAFLLVGCLLLGLLFRLLFYDSPPGMSYPIFVLGFYAVFLWNARRIRPVTGFGPSFGWVLAVPVLLLSCTYFFFTNGIFRFFNFFAVPMLIAAQTTLVTRNNQYSWYSGKFIYDILYSVFGRTLGNIDRPFILAYRFVSRTNGGRRNEAAGRILLGLVISVPLMVVIVSLLSSADQVFEHMIAQIPGLLSGIGLGEILFQAVMILTITVLSFSYLWSLLDKATGVRTAAASDWQPAETVPTYRNWDPVTMITVLMMVNVIYVIFTVIQFSYLFGGINFALPSEFTYAQYARRGFFELVAVTLINLSILLCSMQFTKKAGKVLDQTIRILNLLLLACTLVMLFSAHFRMSLYEEVFGYTYLRVLTHAFMVFIFALLAATFCKMLNEKMRLLKAYIIISLVAYVFINFAGVDTFIARKNVERYKESGVIDIHYLTRLSYEAIPQLIVLLEDPNPEVAAGIRNYLYMKKEELAEKGSWQAFNLSEYRVKKILEGYPLQYQGPVYK